MFRKREREIISHKAFLKSFRRSQLPHKSVNVSFTITDIKNQMTDMWANGLLQNDLINTFCNLRV